MWRYHEFRCWYVLHVLLGNAGKKKCTDPDPLMCCLAQDLAERERESMQMRSACDFHASHCCGVKFRYMWLKSKNRDFVEVVHTWVIWRKELVVSYQNIAQVRWNTAVHSRPLNETYKHCFHSGLNALRSRHTQMDTEKIKFRKKVLLFVRDNFLWGKRSRHVFTFFWNSTCFPFTC